MDLRTVKKACKSSLFKNHFKGVIFVDTLEKQVKNGQIGDFYVINTDHMLGEHWLSLLRGEDIWILFDSSKFTDNTTYRKLQKYLNLPLIIDCQQIQGLSSLTCGEHALGALTLMFPLVMSSPEKFRLHTYPSNFYANHLLTYVSRKRMSADKFMLDFIYNKLKYKLHILPERKSEVSEWLRKRCKI